MTFKELRDKQDALFSKMKEAQTLIELPPAQRAERLARCERDKLEFFRLYCPHYFAKNAFALNHPELLTYCDIKDVPVLLAAPRGSAKSAICTFGDLLHKILYKQIRFGIVASVTEDIAAGFTADALLEFELNPRLKQDFGELRGMYDWAANNFVTRSNIRVLARGIGQRVRGIKHGDARPDFFCGDDLEDDESARSVERVNKLINWFWSAVYPALRPPAEGGAYIRWLGTLISRMSALYRMFEDQTRKIIKRKWGLIEYDSAGRRYSIWPSRFPLVECDRIRAQVGPKVWQAEYMNDPLPEEDRVFREEWDKFYSEEMSPEFSRAITLGAADPSATQTGDDKAILIGSSFAESPMIYCRHAFIRKTSVEPFIIQLHELTRQYHCRIRVEENALKEFLWQTISDYEIAHNVQLPLDPVHHSANKIMRLSRLQAPWERGEFRFLAHHSDQDKLLEEAHLFPDSANDNGLDAWEEVYSGICDVKYQGSDDVRGTGQFRDFVAAPARAAFETYLKR